MTTIPQVLSDERIVQIGQRMAWRYKRSSDPTHSDTYTFNRARLLDFTRAAVAEALAAPSPVAPMQELPSGPVLHGPSGFVFDEVLAAADVGTLVALTPQSAAAPSPVAPVLPAGDALPSERSAAFLDWWHEHGRKLCITPECAEYVFEAGRAALSKQVPAGEAWKPIETAPPLRKLIVAYKNSAGKWRRVLATYWPAETRESEHSESGWADEGWYEATEAYEELAPLEGDPVCWVAMPPINDASVPSALSQSGQADSTGDAK